MFPQHLHALVSSHIPSCAAHMRVDGQLYPQNDLANGKIGGFGQVSDW
jgi:hypothetical protein